MNLRIGWVGALALFGVMASHAFAAELPLQAIRLPPGFHIQVYAHNVPDARSMAVAPDGTVFVGSRSAGKVYALLDRDHDGHVEEVLTIASGLRMPNGVAFRNGNLYVAAVDRILRFNKILDHLREPPEPQVINDTLPSDNHHGWRYLRFGPDGLLYVGIGAPCNICLQPNYAQIKRLRTDGTQLQTYARGIRNTVGFDWDPNTKELWFTDNGRDWLGDDRPPDELNHAPRAGMNFGFPFCHGADIPDPEFGKQHSCSEFTPPALALGAHVAPLGVHFYDGSKFPAVYRGQMFIAEHGSWNRSSKVGYRIVSVRLEHDRPAESKVFAQGWLQGQKAWGRPVDIAWLPDGAMLVSDDYAGVVYRITYSGADRGKD